MRSFVPFAFRGRALLALAALLVAPVLACGGDGQTSGGGGHGNGGKGGQGSTGDCPAGTHDWEGACVTTLDAWSSGPLIATARDHHLTFVAETPESAFLYVVGGAEHASTAVTSMERAKLAADGTPGPWETLPTELEIVGGGVVVRGQKALFTGGFRGPTTSTKTDLVTIADDGSLALEPGPELALSRFHHGTVMSGNFVYVTGGFSEDEISVDSIERATFDDQGVGAWTEDRPFPQPRSHHAVVEHGGAIYAVAGFTRRASDTPPYWVDENLADVIRATVGPDGSLGEWTHAGDLAKPLAIHAAFVHDDALYVVGGIEGPTKGGTFVGTVRRAAFRDDGTLEAFEDLSTSLPMPRGHCHHAPVYGDNVYSVGGMMVDGIQMHSEADAFFSKFE